MRQGLGWLVIILSLVIFILIGISSWAYPRGTFYATGEQIEFNDGNSVRPEFKEDITGLDLPGWVSFFRRQFSTLFVLALVALTISACFLFNRHESTKVTYESQLKDLPPGDLTTFVKAMRLNVEDAGAYYNLGIAFAKVGHHDRAIEKYNSAISYNPSYIDAYAKRALAYTALYMDEEAQQDIDQTGQLVGEDDTSLKKIIALTDEMKSEVGCQ